MYLQLKKVLIGFWISLSFCFTHVKGIYNHHYMEDDCNPNGTNIYLKPPNSLYGHVKMVREGGYSRNLHCKMTIWAPEHYHITVRFERIEIFKPDYECTTDYLLLSGDTETHPFCGTGTPRYSLYSTGSHLELEFFSGDHEGFENTRMGYWLYYTAYHQGPCDKENGREFECYRDHRCIPGELKCDNLDNCGDWADESAGPCGLPAATIVLITLVTLACVGVCVAAGVYFCIDKKKDRNRRLRRQAQNNAVPSVAYNQGLDPNAPPPYSTYFTTPAYTEQKEQPPAYDNYGYAAAGSVTMTTTENTTTDPTATTTSDDTTANTTTGIYESIPADSNGTSSVVTPPTTSQLSMPPHTDVTLAVDSDI